MKYEAIIETKSIRRGWVILTLCLPSRLLNSVYAVLRVWDQTATFLLY